MCRILKWLGEVSQNAANACYGAVITQDLHNGVQVRGVGFAGDSLTNEGRNIGHCTGEGSGIGLVSLHIRGETHVSGDGLDLLEPGIGIVSNVELLQEAVQGIGNRCLVEFLIEERLFQILIVEESHVGLSILPDCQVLSGLLSAAADGQNLGGEVCIGSQLFAEVRIEFLGPLRQQLVDPGCIHTADDILTYICQLGIVKEGTGGVQLLGAELEAVSGSIGIGTAPVLKVGAWSKVAQKNVLILSLR